MDKVIIDRIDVSDYANYWFDRCCEINRECSKLKEENEQLKADIESRTMCITCERELQNCNLQAENERLKRELSGKRFICPQCMEFAKEIHKYKQTLQEIREIAEYTYDPVDKDNDPCYSILTKINEVIGAE